MNDNKNNKNYDSVVEKLVMVDTSVISTAAIKTAAEEIAKETSAQQVANAKRCLQFADEMISSAVANLREARKAEKVAKERVNKLVAAREEFVKTGDWNKYELARREARCL